jgi:hypothetical protein
MGPRTDRDGAGVPVGAAIALAALFTAGVHLYLAATPSGSALLRVAFVGAALGYLGTSAALLLPLPGPEWIRPAARAALLVVTVVTIIGYFVVMGGELTTLAIVDKLAEAVLVLLVVADAALARSRARSGAVPGPAERSAGGTRAA